MKNPKRFTIQTPDGELIWTKGEGLTGHPNALSTIRGALTGEQVAMTPTGPFWRLNQFDAYGVVDAAFRIWSEIELSEEAPNLRDLQIPPSIPGRIY